MGNNSNSFKSVKSENNSYSIPKGKIGFARGFLVPFVAGVLGTLIIVGGCISIPSIRETISEKLYQILVNLKAQQNQMTNHQ